MGVYQQLNLDKLKYYGEQKFLFKVLHKGTKETYCSYIATADNAPEIDNIFLTYFERIHIPEFVHDQGKPSEALEVLKEEDDTAKQYIQVLEFIQELKNCLVKILKK